MSISGQHIVLEDQLLGKLSGIKLEQKWNLWNVKQKIFFQKFVDFCPYYNHASCNRCETQPFLSLYFLTTFSSDMVIMELPQKYSKR